MANTLSLGKKFELKFKEDFLKVPGSTIDRLYDVTMGYKHISSVSDFIGYVYPNIFYLECKSHKGNTFPLTNLTQYDKLIEKAGIQGVRAGAIIWFYEHDRVVYVPVATIKKMKDDGKKSVNITKDLDEYRIIEIPGKKLRTFIDSDYTVLKNLEEGD